MNRITKYSDMYNIVKIKAILMTIRDNIAQAVMFFGFLNQKT